ncbi:hypothetical protein B296_00014990 [Ensete ventricosum]|uniref:Uncharacterized protein n=1 Tax=Ensete ventricosum TaxID=4639 RepID=A0A427B238_ENSVE|nr:hypothetical protein B296_00014990 [Ensete ventricosum]
MVEFTFKRDHIVAKALTVPKSSRALDDRTTATDTESPEGRLKTIDLWAEILTDRDSEWEEAKDIRPARETIGGKREGMKVNNVGIADTRDDKETAATAGKKHAE